MTNRRKPSIVVTALLALNFVSATIQAQDASPSPSLSATAASTPIALDQVPSEAESAFGELHQIEDTLSKARAALESTNVGLTNLKAEVKARMAEDARILAGSPSLDLLYPLRTNWQTYTASLTSSEQDLTQRAANLEDQLASLRQMNQVWQPTLESAPKINMPPAVLQRVQKVVERIDKTNRTAESDRARVLTLQSSLLMEEARVRRATAAIARAQSQALKDLLERDGQPIWTAPSTLTTELQTQSDESLSSQWSATSAFIQRRPSSFVVHAALILLLAGFIQWLRRQIRKPAVAEPALERALSILDLPVSTAFVLSSLFGPALYSEAPRWIQALVGAVALVPTVLILRRLLERNLFPILYALVGLYLITQLRLLAASVPSLGRFFFLVETCGGFLFLIWFLRSGLVAPKLGERGPVMAKLGEGGPVAPKLGESGPVMAKLGEGGPVAPKPGESGPLMAKLGEGGKLATAKPGTPDRFSRAILLIAKIGLIVFPIAALANILGYVNLANLLAIVFVRGVFLAAIFYVAIRVLDGFVVIALQVRPLGALHAVQLHRRMLYRRSCRALGFLAVLFWLDLMLNFFGLLNPSLAKIGDLLDAKVGMGSLELSLGRLLAFGITAWAAFLVSKFLRFLLEEDVYHHFRLERGLPYAISTMLHYSILLVGFVAALGALGIDLTKITILAGAFSVGVGFGLQNVINNFVSGLILLFERPIKIGDVIEIDGTVGEVRRIGIRACVIRTGQGSEIIVPNGALISNQVTNWTFSDRARAIEVSVNVLPGADSQRVTELLRTTATSEPGVASEPAPQVYVVNFSAGAITFQLRAWTDRYQDWARVRSDLAVAVNSALAEERIAIA
ncbi:MAG: mechanosensitive ion channel domain-containing protein [Chthoniobacterales bacterium]